MTTTENAATALATVIVEAARQGTDLNEFEYDGRALTVWADGRQEAERLADALECLRAPDVTSILDRKTLRWVGTVAGVHVRIEVVE